MKINTTNNLYCRKFLPAMLRAGWEITDEAHGGNLIPHYYTFRHRSDTNRDGTDEISISAASTPTGKPGKIVAFYVYQDSRYLEQVITLARK